MGREDADVEKTYSTRETASKLRRLAEALEAGESFRIQIAGERVSIPADATIEIEYEREGAMEEVEVEIKWTRKT
ncbi:hypothetical protein BH18ACI2_BH18ACI2_25940 [soil metagenome]